MSKFLGMHQLPPDMTEEELQAVFAKYTQKCADLGIKAKKVFYNLEKGIAHCVTEAESEDQVIKAHGGAIALENVLEVKSIKND